MILQHRQLVMISNRSVLFSVQTAVSYVPQFRDAASPVGDLLVSPNFGMSDTTRFLNKTVSRANSMSYILCSLM